ncbi:hypothetical protein PanWU01x14_223530, partial [Parasponia andersonii]
MKIGDVVVDDMHLISNHIQPFYMDLFAEPQCQYHDYLLVQEVIPKLVSSSENAEFCRVPNDEEIRLTVFEMDALSSPGPD